jgi:hypothetical protein
LPEGERPETAAGEEVTLGESPEIVGPNIGSWSLIYLSRRDGASLNGLPQDLGLEGFDFVVVCRHLGSLARIWPPCAPA